MPAYRLAEHTQRGSTPTLYEAWRFGGAGCPVIKFRNMEILENATDNLAIGIYYSVGGYYISNEGTKNDPNYHVWVPGITHANCDSAYNDLSIAISRCNYLYKNKVRLN